MTDELRSARATKALLDLAKALSTEGLHTTSAVLACAAGALNDGSHSELAAICSDFATKRLAINAKIVQAGMN